MRIAVSYLTNNPKTNFVPIKIFELESDQMTVWLTVCGGRFPPLGFNKLINSSCHPGIDGQFIEMDIIIGRYYPQIGDIISLKGYDMIIQEIG